jgi:YihY family inner membrane protein
MPSPWLANRWPAGDRIVSAVLNDRLLQVASSLAFTTILAIVPLLAVTLAMMTAFPIFADFESALQTFLRQQLMPEAFSETIMRYIDDFVSKASRLSAVGGIFLVVTAVFVIVSVDDALNDIWHVRRQRPIGQRLLIYWAVLTLGPLILGASLWTSTFVAREALGLGLGFGSTQSFIPLGQWLPFIIGSLGISLLLMTVPNCRVKPSHALIGGVTVAVLFELIKWGLGVYLSQIPTYTVIYGAFSVLPAFLLWIYLSWLALLFGAVVAANLPNLQSNDRHPIYMPSDNRVAQSYNQPNKSSQQSTEAITPGDKTMLKVSEILRVKGNTLFTASPDMPVMQAIQTMSEHDIGSLVIMDHGTLAGMLTFREILRHLNTHEGSVGDYTIRAIMDDAPISVTPNTDADEVQRLMLAKHSRYIPVMDGPTLMGVISFYDMAQALAAAQQFENSMLKAYIRDWPTEQGNSA